MLLKSAHSRVNIRMYVHNYICAVQSVTVCTYVWQAQVHYSTVSGLI